mmetsp:Transcript_26083/g.60866  ORF Transcript_26083/g.60866 Transcript_26083/m.60866 type:complete len:127 (-) Transcript_26083:1380-1760(-)
MVLTQRTVQQRTSLLPVSAREDAAASPTAATGLAPEIAEVLKKLLEALVQSVRRSGNHRHLPRQVCLLSVDLEERSHLSRFALAVAAAQLSQASPRAAQNVSGLMALTPRTVQGKLDSRLIALPQQ